MKSFSQHAPNLYKARTKVLAKRKREKTTTAGIADRITHGARLTRRAHARLYKRKSPSMPPMSLIDRNSGRPYTIQMYVPQIEHILRTLSEKRIMVLATSRDGQVTARNMSVLVDYDAVYCQTDSRMEKTHAVERNPRAAYCVDNYQIYGTARVIGTWDDHPELRQKFKAVHAGSYERYKNLTTEVVIAFQIERIQIWEYENNIPYIVTADLLRNTYEKTEYTIA